MKKMQYFILFVTITLLIVSCSENNINNDNNILKDTTVKVTFIEFGANNCIPCLNMRPIMDSIQKKYGYSVFVKFVDVYKEPKLANDYQIIAMPTQVFLDSAKIEFFRHRGFFPEDSIDILLQSRGLKILKN